jgi:hypothetical protein
MANIKSLRLPDAVDWPQQELHDMQFYVERSDNISCTESTATANIFKLQQPYIIKEIGWACIDAWESSASVPYSVIIKVGDTATVNKYGTLTIAELGSTVRSGTIAAWEESTGTSVDFITMTIDHGAISSDAAEGSGEMYLWVVWAPRAEKMSWANRRQVYST